MIPIADDVWSVPAPLRFAGLAVNTRMTVCRLPDERLVLISPTPCTDASRAAISALGTVAAVVAPSLFHHLHVGGWLEACPEATGFAPPGLAQKRPDLPALASFREFDIEFGDVFTRVAIEGMPKIDESLFFHRPSATLIATDFCFFMPDATGLTGLFATLTGVKSRPRCEPLFRFLVKDKAAFRASLKPLWSLRLRRLSMCHHGVLETAPTEALHAVLRQLKVPQQARLGHLAGADSAPATADH